MSTTHSPRPLIARALVLPLGIVLIGISTIGSGGPIALAQLPVPGGPAPGAGPVTPDERRDVVERIAKLLEDRYVFPELGVKTGNALKVELDRGTFDAVTDPKSFAEALTTALQSTSHDKHMRVVVKPPDAVGQDLADPIAEHLRQRNAMESQNFGFNRLERMEGNIGYLDLRSFAPAELGAEKADAAMRFLAGSDAIVIDLRKNGGGSPDMVRLLCSHFFDKPTHLNSLYFRDGDRTQDFWTTPDVQPRMDDVPLFVVTSSRTFSGAEEFSYNMQSQKRATLVGEVTGGGANPGGVFQANNRFGVFVPTGRAINPVTKSNWEGVGVTPDVVVAADAALDTALALARVAADLHRSAELESGRIVREAFRRELARAKTLAGSGSVDEAKQVVNAALESARTEGVIDEGLINWLGYDYMSRKELAMAIIVFEFNTRAFPESGNTFDSLGEALMNAGQTELAIEKYRRSLELDPRNVNAKSMIEKLEGASR